jgi:aspartate racemase
MKTIGILGGLGPESTISYYKYITRAYHALRNDYAYPDIIISSLSFQRVIDADYETPQIIREAICGLAGAGADFVVAACNSIHAVYDEVSKDIPIPWVSIMDATAGQILSQNISRVGLLGTRVTMQKGFYQTALARHQIETITPSAKVQERINYIIFDELVRAKTSPDSVQFLLDCVGELKDNGAEGVILGCTELPFAIKQDSTPVPLFDTTAIHSQKALELALVKDDA